MAERSESDGKFKLVELFDLWSLLSSSRFECSESESGRVYTLL